MRVTPDLNAEGRFVLREPWRAENKDYWVDAIRSLDDVRKLEDNPIGLIYTPVGLGDAEYRSDIDEGAMIITLRSDDGQIIYVPDTYIVSVPRVDAIPYSHLIVSASLGPFPDTYNTALLEAKVSAVISDYIGVEPQVNIARAPMRGTITYDRHRQLTSARQAAVRLRDTDRATALELEQLVRQQQDQILLLERLLIEHGVVQIP